MASVFKTELKVSLPALNVRDRGQQPRPRLNPQYESECKYRNVSKYIPIRSANEFQDLPILSEFDATDVLAGVATLLAADFALDSVSTFGANSPRERPSLSWRRKIGRAHV